MLTFTVPGPPKGKGRPRATTVGGHARMYTPKATETYEGIVRMSAAAAQGAAPPIDGPVGMLVRIILPRPRRLMRRGDPAGLVWAPSKPDADNVLKAVLDGCACLWRDDAQVVQVSLQKHYAEKVGQPRVEVSVMELGPL